MEFIENGFYHIYNRGNNRQLIFFKPENYIFFLNKIRKYILPHCDILCFCLMPNHFHLLLATDGRSIEKKQIGNQAKNILSEGFKNLLSTYTQAINKQNGSIGSLFQQNTKSKALTNETDISMVFHYIHQNPVKAGLCNKLEDWYYSSFKDYIGQRNGTLCNKQLTAQILDVDPSTLYNDSYKTIIDETTLKNIV
jgi:putative transposase